MTRVWPRGEDHHNYIPVQTRFEEKYIPEPNSGCWLWTAGVNTCGYGTIGVKYRSTLAHRLAWTLYKGDIPDGLNVLHRCDTPCCVNPDHLFLGTQTENIHDMERKSRSYHPAGEKHGRAILTEQQVREIRAAPSSRGLAKKYGVSRHVIQYARKFETWKTIA